MSNSSYFLYFPSSAENSLLSRIPWSRGIVRAVYRAAVADSHPERGARGGHGPGSLRAQPWGDIGGPGGDVCLPREDYGACHEVGGQCLSLADTNCAGIVVSAPSRLLHLKRRCS